MCPSETDKCGQVENLTSVQVDIVRFMVLPIYFTYMYHHGPQDYLSLVNMACYICHVVTLMP